MAEAVLFRDVHLLDLGSPDGMSERTDLLTLDGQIARIGGAMFHPGARIVEGRGNLLMPGLVNAHFHSSVNHMKGRLPCLPLEIFMLYESPALDVLRPTPREAYLRTMLGCMEMLRGGTTCVGDDCFFVPEASPEIIDAVFQAYADSGIRAVVALDEPELSEMEKLPPLKAIAPASLHEQLSTRPALDRIALLDLVQHVITKWHDAEGGRLRAAVSCSAPQRVSKEYFSALDDLSRRHDLPFFAHMLETKLQRVQAMDMFDGRSLVGYTHDLGLLSERMLVIHAIWADDADLDLIADCGAAIAHNPNSNLRLGSGIMPLRKVLDRQIPFCLGVDEAIADDAINMWSVMKTAGMLHTLTDPNFEHWPTAKDILTAATEGGGRALRVDGLGRLEPSAPADLVMVDLSTLSFLPLNDLPRQLVHVELGQSVRLSMVAGRIVFEDGRLSCIDEDALMDEARETFAKQKSALQRAADQVAPLVPIYRQMVADAVAADIGMDRTLWESGS